MQPTITQPNETPVPSQPAELPMYEPGAEPTQVDAVKTTKVDPSETPAPKLPDMEPIRWQASEYIEREKGRGWFVWFVIAVIALMAAAIFIIKSPTFAILIPVMAVALVVYTRHGPDVFDYTLSSEGLYINDVLSPYDNFKAFGVMRSENESSIILIPQKRFQPGVTVYFPDNLGEVIVDTFGARLPMQEVKPDAIDKMLRKLRI